MFQQFCSTDPAFSFQSSAKYSLKGLMHTAKQPEIALHGATFSSVCVCVCVCEREREKPLESQKHPMICSRGCQGCTLDWHQRRRQCCICEIDLGLQIDVPALNTLTPLVRPPSGCFRYCKALTSSAGVHVCLKAMMGPRFKLG